MNHDTIKALAFDVFGTVVDWRNSVTREVRELGAAKGIAGIDWKQFADDWRALYQPSMARVRDGERPGQSLMRCTGRALSSCSNATGSRA